MKKYIAKIIFSVFVFAFLFACKTNTTDNAGEYEITFGVEGGNGKISAELNGASILSGLKVKKGEKITFIAHPNKDYVVASWQGAEASSKDENQASLVVSSRAHVKVVFKEFSVDLPQDFVRVVPPDYIHYTAIKLVLKAVL